MPFTKLSLDPQILKAIEQAGYTTPSAIQERAIPEILKGSDIRGSAQTGTGKTAAFLLPCLNLLLTNPEGKGRGPRVLIVVPTRELAMQIKDQAKKYSRCMRRVHTVCISGGVSYHIQRRELSRPCDILVATPGRLIDYIEQGQIDFSRVEMLVLDEADRMLDMGFVEPVEQIVATIPQNRQTLLFSATLQGSVLKLSERLLNNPVDIIIEPEFDSKENITQQIYYSDNLGHKNMMLDHILEHENEGKKIIFTATKRHADQLVNELSDKGHRVSALHGDMNQGQRTRTIKKLREGKIDILVATDVAARGIDVQSITHVINFDLPRSIEDYVHRIGRTGRAGASGIALSFASMSESGLVKRIERFTEKEIEIKTIQGLEPQKRPAGFRSKGKRTNKSNSYKPQGYSNYQSKRPSKFGKPSFGANGNKFGKPGRSQSSGGQFGKPSGNSSGDSFGRSGSPEANGNKYGKPNFDKPSFGNRSGNSYGRPSRPAANGNKFGKPSFGSGSGNSFSKPSRPGGSGNKFHKPGKSNSKSSFARPSRSKASH